MTFPRLFQEPLNSGDDVSDAEDQELFDTENVVVCQYDKVKSPEAERESERGKYLWEGVREEGRGRGRDVEKGEGTREQTCV